jgi:type IV pilus secretin PilQ/predicted competence protein
MNASRGVCLWIVVWFLAGVAGISTAVTLNEEFAFTDQRSEAKVEAETAVPEPAVSKPAILTAADVSVSSTGVRISLTGDRSFDYKTFRLENPDRIVLDVKGVSGPIDVVRPENHSYVKRIRYAVNRHLETGVVVRYVIETAAQAEYRVDQVSSSLELWIETPELPETIADFVSSVAPVEAEPTFEFITPIKSEPLSAMPSQAGPFLSAQSNSGVTSQPILVPMAPEQRWSSVKPEAPDVAAVETDGATSQESDFEPFSEMFITQTEQPFAVAASADDPECYPYTDGTQPDFIVIPEVIPAPAAVATTDGYRHGTDDDTLIDHYWLRPDDAIRVASLEQLQAAAAPSQVIPAELPVAVEPVVAPEAVEEDLFQNVIDRHYPAAAERARNEWIDPRKRDHDSAPILSSDPDYRLADAEISSLSPMSMDVQGGDIHTILRSVAEYAGVNVVADSDVKGTLTIRVIDLPWKDTLETVCRASALVPLYQSDTVIRIATARTANDEMVAGETAARKKEDVMPLTTRIIPLEYAAASEMKDVASSVRSLRGTVDVDARTNSVIVTDIAPRVDLIEDMLAGLDTETMQVEITAEIVDIDITEAQQLGISWNASNIHSSSLNLDAIAGVTTDDVVDAAGDLQAGIIRDFGQIKMRIQALASENKADIISTPRITTVNNRMATILVGKEVPLITLDEAGNPITELKKVGITLQVTPYLNSDDKITLDLHPEVSDLSAQSTVQGGIVFNTTEADTRVMVKDGETVVIGGLINTKTIKYKRGIPILKDVPLFGRLFSSSDEREEKRELLIFVTPRIVKNSSAGRFLSNPASDK